MARDGFKFEMQGGREVAKVLEQLPSAIAEHVYKQALRHGLKAIQKEARRLAPYSGGEPTWQQYGHLRNNIKIRTAKKSELPPGVQFRMIMHTGDAFWGIFLEYGQGNVRAQPFFRPAVDTKDQEAARRIVEKAAKGVEREAEKLTRKFGSLDKATKRRLARS